MNNFQIRLREVLFEDTGLTEEELNQLEEIAISGLISNNEEERDDNDE